MLSAFPEESKARKAEHNRRGCVHETLARSRAAEMFGQFFWSQQQDANCAWWAGVLVSLNSFGHEQTGPTSFNIE